MTEVIEIAVPIEEIEARRERVNQAENFGTPDRVPVLPGMSTRYLVPQVGVSFKDYYSDPEVMLRTQIFAQKWHLENVRTDAHDITGAWVGGWTDFQNTYEAGSLGCEIHFPDDDIPWIGASWVKTDEDLRKVEEMDFVHSGINKRQIEYRRAMMAVAEKYPVRFQGGPTFFPGEDPALTHASGGPFSLAGDLVGQTDIFLMTYERPDYLREVLRIVTDKILDWLEYCQEEMQLPNRDLIWSDDPAVLLSPKQFREFALPYNQQLRSRFDGWGLLHMCGKSDHLLEIFADDLNINVLQGIGFQVDLDRIASTLGGRVVLIGNVNPMLIHSGTPEQIREATRQVIEKLAHYKGLIVQDGNNIPPGTPLENINAMMEAAELYGRYQ
jgi:uroporphyrinogen decarboxylase